MCPVPPVRRRRDACATLKFCQRRFWIRHVQQNNFTGNSFDVTTNGTLKEIYFNNNYWDKYEGYDLNKDGIGDVPYRPISLYAQIIEQNPQSVMLMRSFIVNLLDKVERAIPSVTPKSVMDEKPRMKPWKR